MVQFDRLLGNKKLIKILDFLFDNPTQEFSQTELIKKIRIAKATIGKWLKLLEKEDFIRVKSIGLTKLYKLNNNNILVKELKKLKNLIGLEKIKEIGEKHNVKIFLYGSHARGENTEESDVDLLVIGKATKEAIFPEVKKINKDINIQIFTPPHWSEMSRKDPSFYERVEKDRIELT
jgi:predicted nucleotidyltransferase